MSAGEVQRRFPDAVDDSVTGKKAKALKVRRTVAGLFDATVDFVFDDDRLDDVLVLVQSDLVTAVTADSRFDELRLALTQKYGKESGCVHGLETEHLHEITCKWAPGALSVTLHMLQVGDNAPMLGIDYEPAATAQGTSGL